LNSCLIETINNAFNRFAQLGICVINNYEFSGEEGPGIYYLKSNIKSKTLIDRYLNVLESMSSCSGNAEKSHVLEVEVQNSLKLSTGNLMHKL
jgi:hypothetical protein